MYNLILGDCLDEMRKMDDCSVDLTVTSPPYDNLRTYNGNISQWNFGKFQQIAKELYRVTAEGGVVVWVVGDATIKGSETGTSFKQALYFKECGFNLHDTMIWLKKNPIPNDPKQNRYIQSFEYMFIFSKWKPEKCNYIKEKAKCAGLITNNTSQIKADGEVRKDRKEKRKGMTVAQEHPLTNVWPYANITRAEKQNHPAQFPEQLANDHILSWSNEGDTVFDPFMGSGTTGKMALLNGRNFIGIELDQTYFEISKHRIEEAVK